VIVTALAFAAVLSAVLDAHAFGLSSPEWRTREAAAAALGGLYPLSEPHLGRLTRSSDPEARRRAREVLRGRTDHCDPVHRLYREFVETTHYRNWPWLDSLPHGTEVRELVIGRYRLLGVEAVGEDCECWPQYRAATAFYCRDLLTSGVPKSEVLLLLRRMVDGDRRQWERSGGRWEWAGE
jgi:hypothetical protein